MKSRIGLRLGDVTVVDCGTQRERSRSVSWNSTGSWLAGATSERLAKIWTVEGGGSQGREVLSISGHNSAVERVRFHPTDANSLCTAALDRTIRLWDVRSGVQRAMGRIELKSAPGRFGMGVASSIEWAPSGTLLAVTERDGTVYLYDTRKLSSSGNKVGRGNSTENPLHSFPLKSHVTESCVFSPSGKYLVAATTPQGDGGMGELRVWNWQDESEEKFMYPAHTGPIYSHVFSPDGSRLGSGGSDAIVGLWDVKTMVCTHTIARHTKFVRSVAFSHDSRLVASSTEDEPIDVADASSGQLIGKVGRGGADEVAFHPKAHVLAWARGDYVAKPGEQRPPPVAVAVLNMS